MPFVKGKSGNPAGKPRGAVSKQTQNARAAIGMLVEQNIPRMQGWLDAIAEKDGPAAAWRCLQDVVEYHIPKLQRTEHANADGEPFVIEITRFSDALKAPGK